MSRNPFKKGDRVRLNGEGMWMLGHRGAHTGTVAAKPRTDRLVTVLMDGLKTPARYWVGWLRKIRRSA